MAEETRLQFIKAVSELDGSIMIDVLPKLSLTDLQVIRQYWMDGHLGKLDPTNVLCAGDYADQFLNLTDHAIALYDAALEFMYRHPESIADDTDCAAASLNLIDILAKAGREKAAWDAAKRAAEMPVKRPEQNVQLAMWLSRVSNGADMTKAYRLFKRAEATGLGAVAEAMGVSIRDLDQMGTFLERAAAGGQSFTSSPW